MFTSNSFGFERATFVLFCVDSAVFLDVSCWDGFDAGRVGCRWEFGVDSVTRSITELSL